MVSTKANRKAFIDSVEEYMKYVSFCSLLILSLAEFGNVKTRTDLSVKEIWFSRR